jgi:hypothetical protein
MFYRKNSSFLFEFFLLYLPNSNNIIRTVYIIYGNYLVIYRYNNPKIWK